MENETKNLIVGISLIIMTIMSVIGVLAQVPLTKPKPTIVCEEEERAEWFKECQSRESYVGSGCQSHREWCKQWAESRFCWEETKEEK